MTGHGQNPIEQQVSNFASKVDSLRFFMFLVHPDQRPFSEYLDSGGTIPDKFRESLYGLAKTASMFGFDADINGDVTQMINSLTPDMLAGIVENFLKTDENGNTDIDGFKTLFEKHPELQGVLAEVVQPVIMRQLPDMSLEGARALVKMDITLPEKLSALTISELDDLGAIEDAVQGVSNQEILVLLDSLPNDPPENIKSGIVKQLTHDGDTPLKGLENFSAEDSFEDIIKARAELGEASAGWFGVLGLFNDKAKTNDSSINLVYDEIRKQLPEVLRSTVKKQLQALNTNQGAGSFDVDPTIVHALLAKELDEHGTELIKADLTEDRMARIKEGLKQIEDHSFLVQLLPQEIQDEALFKKLREGMAQFGLLGPAGAIVMQLAGFVVNLAQKFLPRFIGQDKADQVVAKLEGFVDPSLEYQNPVMATNEPAGSEPAPNPAAALTS